MNPLHPHQRAVPVVDAEAESMRTPVFVTRRRHWPGIVAAAIIGAGLAAAAVSSFYDSRSLGQKLDATVAAGNDKVQAQVDGFKAGASQAARDGALVSDRVAGALGDTGITAAVKTALAADPALSALKIDVSTNDGVVTLVGPAPDEKSRERAAVLAAAPQGVQRVENRLVLVN